MPKTKKQTEPTIPANDELIDQAIAEGRAIIAQGGTKIDAAMAIYRLLETMSQAVVLQTFIEGATLTEKGALTYWYNCRRRLARERRSAKTQDE